MTVVSLCSKKTQASEYIGGISSKRVARSRMCTRCVELRGRSSCGSVTPASDSLL